MMLARIAALDMTNVSGLRVVHFHRLTPAADGHSVIIEHLDDGMTSSLHGVTLIDTPWYSYLGRWDHFVRP